MKKFNVSRNEFNRLLWNGFVSGAAKSESELDVALRVVRKLKTLSIENTLTKEESEAGIIPGRKLDGPDADVVLEEDEYNAVRDRLIAFIPNVQFVLIEDFHALLTKVKLAVEVKTSPKVVE